MTVLSERRIVSLTLLLVGVGLLFHTFGQTFSGLGAFSPMFFPRLVLVFWVGICALDLAAEIWATREAAPMRLARVSAIALAALVFLVAMPRVGFFLSAVPFSVLALLVLGLRAPAPIAAVAVGVPAALVLLFNHVLTLPLPTSPFTWWF